MPRAASRTAGLTVGFTLSRPAAVTLQIAAANGTAVATVPPVQLGAGAQSISWDGTTTGGLAAPPGSYVAQVNEVSSIGKAGLSAPFTVPR